jgi:hypothetical protein
MKSFIKKSILFLCLALLVSYAVYYALNTFQLKYYAHNLKTRWAIELKDKHVDYVFLGSSRMANMIALQQADSIMHTSSVNLSTAGSSYGESYVLFQQFLAHGNSTKTLVLSFDLFKSRHTSLKNETLTPLVFKHFELFPYYNDPGIKTVYADYTSSAHMYLWEYVPFSRCAEFNNYFKADSIYSYVISGKSPEPSFNSENGEQLIYNFKFKGEKYAAPGGIQLGPRSEKYLLKILDLAQKNNIKIVLVTAPYYHMEKFDRTYHTLYVNFLKQQYHATYWDFTAPKKWDNIGYFVDPIHTNATGSRLYTQMLCDSLTYK